MTQFRFLGYSTWSCEGCNYQNLGGAGPRVSAEEENEDRRLVPSLPGGHCKLLPLKDLMS